MVTLIALAPLLLTIFTCVGAALFALQRKSMAQALCVRQAVQLQDGLRAPLKKLLKLNRRARLLRAQRESADRALEAAVSSGVPYAIAVAQAAQTAVIVAQSELHTEQLLLLSEAGRVRRQGQLELRRQANHLSAREVQTPFLFPLPLAVKPEPALSPSPDYVPIPGFAEGQQQRFQFQIDVLEGFPLSGLGLEVQQKTNCAVTLQPSGDQEWRIRILAAKAS